ncbi:hypothetical protein GCM10029964_076900 [Kibdelosporangium lantanae]
MIALRDFEEILTEHAVDLGVEIERGVAVTGFEDHGDAVTVHTTSGAREAGWLVGCDGGRSLVRKHGGFDFPGSDPELVGRQAIVDIESPQALAGDWTGNEHGTYLVGGWGADGPTRVHVVEYGPQPDRDTPVTPKEVQDSLRRVSGIDVTITKLHVATRYTDTTRQATTYRRGRVFLAGDAAHVHSPPADRASTWASATPSASAASSARSSTAPIPRCWTRTPRNVTRSARGCRRGPWPRPRSAAPTPVRGLSARWSRT